MSEEGTVLRTLRDIAEIALSSAQVGSAVEPGVTWPCLMAALERAVGFDSGFIAATSGTAASSRGAIMGHDEVALRRGVGPYLSHITASEVSIYLNCASRDSDVWSHARRELMAEGYPELCPRVARHMLVWVGLREGELVGINLERRGCAKAFSDRDLELVDVVAPLVHLAAFLAQPASSSERDLRSLWGLTRAESEVARLVVRGLQNAEVGQVLGLSINTVRNALTRVFAKAGASTRAELVFIAHESAPPAKHQCAYASAPADGIHAFVNVVKLLKKRDPCGTRSTMERMPKPRFIYSPPVSHGDPDMDVQRGRAGVGGAL